MEPGLRFGTGLMGGDSETANSARRLEELGFDFLSTGEHFMRGDPPTPTSL